MMWKRMEMFLLLNAVCTLLLLSSMESAEAVTPIQRRMVGGNVTFPWMIIAEDNLGKILFAPDKKTIIRVDKGSKPVYEHPSLYRNRASLLSDGVILRDLSKSDEGLYRSKDLNHPTMNNTMLFVYTDKDLWPQIFVGDRLLTPMTTHAELQVQEDIKIYVGQYLYANITLQSSSSFWKTTSCNNAPMCVHHVETSPDPDFNTNISVSVTVDYGFYEQETNFTVDVNATLDDATNGCSKCHGWFILGPICILLLILLVWTNRRNIEILVLKLKCRTKRNPEQIPLMGEELTTCLEAMISEAKTDDENKRAELRKNFMDRYLRDLVGDDDQGNDNWDQFSCDHGKQIWELINLLTKSGPSDNPIKLSHCIGFAQFCLEKWNDKDNYDIVEIVLFVLFKLTKWKQEQHKISRNHLETTARFLHCESQKVSFLSCRYLVLILYIELYKNIDNWEEWKRCIQEEMFQAINNWKLEELCIRKTRTVFSHIQHWLKCEDEPVIQYFAVWLIQQYLYDKTDINLMEQYIDGDLFDLVHDPRLTSLVDQVKKEYENALESYKWKLQVEEW